MAPPIGYMYMVKDLQQEGFFGKRKIAKDPRIMTAKDRVLIYLPISYCVLCSNYGVIQEHKQYEDNSYLVDYGNNVDTD